MKSMCGALMKKTVKVRVHRRHRNNGWFKMDIAITQTMGRPLLLMCPWIII